MKKIQKSMSFLIYTLNIPSSHLWRGLASSYAGNYDYTGDDTWGEHLSLLYRTRDITEEQIDIIRKNKGYVHEYDPDTDHIMFVLKIPTKYKKNVVTPFLKGEYSKIDREYVNANFKQTASNGSYSTNWLILTKDKSLRKFWEDQIGVPLPHDAEVWSRPLKEDEVYNYESFLVVQNLNEDISVKEDIY